MKAGQTNIEVGTEVVICNMTGEDAPLNGFTGTVTHPFYFGCTDKDWVGIYLNDGRECIYGGQSPPPEGRGLSREA